MISKQLAEKIVVSKVSYP